jgi:hypothetical protein
MIENNCNRCIYKASAGSNTRHSKCTHPRVDFLLSDHGDLLRVMDGIINKHKIPYLYEEMQVEFRESAIAEGWGSWPFNFDPIWLEHCTGFKAKE